jgi:hypothetical protein
LLKRALRVQVGSVGAGAAVLARMFAAAVAAAVAAYAAGAWLPVAQPWLAALVVAAVFGGVYLILAAAAGLDQARSVAAGLLRRIRRR